MSTKTILHVEDDSDAAYFLKRSLTKSPLNVLLNHVQDGQEAINYLEGLKPFEDRLIYPLPDLIFLDLKLPRKDGFEVLAWIRDKKLPQSPPVVVLSSSDRLDDMEKAKGLGAILYLTKSASFDEAVKVAMDKLG